MPMPLLQTKLYVPPPRSQLVARPAVTAKLEAGMAHPLTLIAAPAGAGKTTLVSEWIAQTGHPVAWLALDEDDNDAVRFLTYLIAALRTVYNQIGETALAALDAPQPLPTKTILTLLLNDLGLPADGFVLVLDDYHLITTHAIHEALTFLIEHLPPSMHLILTSRIDPPLPLARWRVRGQLTELRSDDLAFRTDEAALFLNEVMGLKLTANDIAVLETRTEGWIAGLQLAALSMQGREDVAGFIHSFSGSHRHILGYLLEEVLNRQSAETLDFLLQTAILDRMCGALCDAVTGQSTGFATLQRLEQASLFLIPLDDEGHWYRYHHLFGQVLAARLRQTQAQRVAELHRRACAWLEAQHLLDQAMHHALAIPDLDLAAMLVERHALTLLMQSELVLLRKWVAQLPSPLIQARPRLTLAQGWVLDTLGQLSDASAALNTPALQAADLPADLAGELALLRADIANMQHDPVALDWAQQALQLLPARREDLRVIAQIEIGLAYMRRDDFAAASQALQEVAARAETVENRFVAVDAFAALCAIQVRQGHLSQAVHTCQQALRMVARWPSPALPATGLIYVALGEILCEGNDLDGAAQALTQGLRLLRGTIEKMPLVRGHAALARVRQAQGDSAAAWASLAQAEAWLVQMQIADPKTLAWLQAHQARLWLQQGDLAAAAQWARDCAAAAEIDLHCEEQLTLARLYLAQHRYAADTLLLDGASTVLAAVCAATEQTGWPAYHLEARLLQALTQDAQRDRAGALAALHHALTLAQAGGYVRLLLDEGEAMRRLLFELSRTLTDSTPASYVDTLLAAFDQPRTRATAPATVPPPETPPAQTSVDPLPFTNARDKSATQPLLEPLSERELDVLRLVADGLSNSEVAGKLIVTVGTVKKHLNNVYGKLGVSSRTQAIAKTRALQLL